MGAANSVSRPEIPLYTNLNGSQIRVLAVSKCTSTATQTPIECRLEHVDLDKKPKYFALSYVWGNASNKRKIWVNGHPMVVTENLYSVLDHIRRPTWKLHLGDELQGMSSCFWIDAICINQEDMVEKARQIPRMGDIYTNAARVVAWLGLMRSEEQEKSTWIMREAAKAAEVHLSVASETNDLERAVRVAGDAIVRGLGPQLLKFWETQIAFRENPWFSRIWIAQEVALPKQTPIMVMGTEVASYGGLSILANTFESLQGSNGEMVTRALELTKSQVYMLIRSTVTLQRWGQYSGLGNEERLARSMLEILYPITHGLKATLPQDYIYGILGLVDSKTLPPDLAPDYTKPFAKVFHEYVAHLIGRSGDLRILGCERSQLSGVPSWVPDLRHRGSLSWYPGFRDPAVRASVSFTDDIDVLEVTGVDLSMVVPYHRALKALVPAVPVEDLARVEEEIRGISTSETEAPTSHALWTLMKLLLSASHISSYNDLIRTVRERWEREGSPASDEFFEIPGLDEERIIITEDILARLGEAGQGMSQFALSESGEVGACLRLDLPVRPGDRLCMLKGAILPSVLRPCGERFLFVGSAQYPFKFRGERRFDAEFFAESPISTFVIA